MALNSISDKVYEQELLQWLPPRIVDIHVHVCLQRHSAEIAPERIKNNWAMEVGISQSWEQLRENYRRLFPRQHVSSLAFGNPYHEADAERSNDYVLAGIRDRRNSAQGLLVTRPEWDSEKVARALEQGFLGIKPYPDLAPQDSHDVGIYDFVPHHHLEVLNDFGGILMLHLPRSGRIGDADNIREVREISERFPAITLILAHIGRAYCLPTAQRGLKHLVDCRNVYFDTSANVNADVFAHTLEVIGTERIMFGTDLPVTMMRGKREHVGENYVNYTDEDYFWNTNRKSPEEESTYTYFVYEGVRALINAVRQTGLGVENIEKILYGNAAQLLAADMRVSRKVTVRSQS